MKFSELREQAIELRKRKAEIQKELDEISAEMYAIQCKIPNMTHPDAPAETKILFYGKTPIRRRNNE